MQKDATKPHFGAANEGRISVMIHLLRSQTLLLLGGLELTCKAGETPVASDTEEIFAPTLCYPENLPRILPQFCRHMEIRLLI